MSDDVSELRRLIPAYAGYGDAASRRLSDQQVRAWAGRSLVDLRDRLDMSSVSERFERLLMRCEFGDQRVIKVIENDHFTGSAAAATIEQHDARLVAVAGASQTVASEGVDGFITEFERALDERDAAVLTDGSKR